MNARQAPSALRRRGALALLVAAVAVPTTASATQKAFKRLEGAMHLQAGDWVVFQSVAKNPSETQM